MSYGSDRVEPYVRVASMVHKMLKDAKPAIFRHRAADEIRARQCHRIFTGPHHKCILNNYLDR
jgi:hypothetical protein